MYGLQTLRTIQPYMGRVSHILIMPFSETIQIGDGVVSPFFMRANFSKFWTLKKFSARIFGSLGNGVRLESYFA